MSSYINVAKNPRTGNDEQAAYIDDFFGRHNYAVKFFDGGIYPIEAVDTLIGKDVNPETSLTWEDFFPKTEADSTAEILAERGKRYGEFTGHAQITQCLKEDMRQSDNWDELDDDQAEALEMIAHKIGRILNGDPHYDDSWVDIAGYATLVADRLKSEAKES